MLFKLGVSGFLISYKTYDQGSGKITLACNQKSFAMKDSNSNLKLLEVFTFVLLSFDSSIYSWFILCSPRRCLSCAVLNLATDNRDSTLFLGACCRAEDPPREYWCVELYQPQTWRNWICKLCSKFFNIVSFAFRCFDLDFLFCRRERPLIFS